MTNDTFPKRIAQVGSDTFVIAREGDQFRMYAPGNPAEVSTVRITDKETVCTCTEFIEKGGDSEFRCKHILAVQKIPNATRIPSAVRVPSHAPEPQTSVSSGNGARHMLLKRSISPDGRIDSLSVEFSLAVGSESETEMVEKANAALAIQSVIIAGFLGKESNGNGKDETKGVATNGLKAAKIVAFGFRPTKWGQRAALTFEVEGDRLAFFGSRERLREVLNFAGYPAVGKDLSTPFDTDLACQVTVKKTEDGKYTNIDRVYPRAS
jgi:hypothetical protein